MRRLETNDKRPFIKARCYSDRVIFARTFFAEKLTHSFSPFHLAALEKPKIPFRDRLAMQGRRRAVMGPRGNGKSTVYVAIETIHDIVYQFEEFIVILAEGFTLSKSRLREIRIEIERNKLLREYFGDLHGEVWQAADIETRNGVRILAKSMSSQVRGILHPETGARPTKILLDDAEDSTDVLNPELRERDRRIFQEDIEGSAFPDGRTNMQMTGTPLHREARLPSLRDNPGWSFEAYPALIEPPERADLWQRCREIFAAAGERPEGLSDARRAPALPEDDPISLAHEFYQANRGEMDRGARVLWPDGEPLFALMVWRWTNGEAAFSKEKQLVPRDPALSTFVMESENYPAEGALRHTVDARARCLWVDTREGTRRRVDFRDLTWYAFHDPAKGDTKAKAATVRKLGGDYACITTMGVERGPYGGGFGHIVHAWAARAPVSKQVEEAFSLGEFYHYDGFVIEEDNLELLRSAYRAEAQRRKHLGLYWNLPLRSLAAQTTNKDARISALEPAVVNGWITYNRTLPAVYWNQWIDHPTGDHDDGPDSAEGAYRFGVRRQKRGLSVVRLEAAA